jgi:hypothetical protein
MTEPLSDEKEADSGGEAGEAAAVGRPVGRVLTLSVCGALICAFLVVDFDTAHRVSFPSTELLMAMMVGLCIAQVNLIAVWASLAPGNIVLRISWSVLLGMATWYAFLLGGEVHAPVKRQDAILLGAVLLAAVVILQIPLWIAKKVFRWRLTRGVEDAEQFLLEDRQFHLQHLFVATFLLAVALSPLRSVLPLGTDEAFHSVDGTLFVMLGAVVLCNLVVTIPCIWWSFVSTAAAMWLVLVWLVYCVALTAVEFGGLCAVFGPPGGPANLEFGFFFYVLNVSQCAAVFGTLRIFRALGFRLVRMPAP